MIRSIPTDRWIGASATIICIVEQFGFAIRPLWRSTASGLTSLTTRGTSGCMRQKLVLSTTTAPAATRRGAHSALTAPPAEESTRSRPWIVSSSSGRHSSSPPANGTRLPAERSEAKGTTSDAGNARSASTSSRVEPTAPVAPTSPPLAHRG